MGFLKFLKKDKAKPDLGLDDFDVPPLPPNLDSGNFGKELQEPSINEPVSQPEPEMPAEESYRETLKPKDDLFGIEPELEQPEQFDFPKPKSFEPQTQEYQKQEKPQELYQDESRYYERFERAAVKEERDLLKHRSAKKTVYIRMDKLRLVLGSVNAIKSDLKTANELILKMNDVGIETEKEFDRWKNSLLDLQKKLIFMDKTLFKGDKK